MEKVQRKLAAIVAADVVGYSRLMGDDEVGTLGRLKDLRREIVHPAVAQHGGTVVKTTGDGWLLEFPSAVEAVEFAVSVQREVGERCREESERRLQLRIGINVGDVIVEDDGDIFGDGVNVAARIEALADPGGICISRSVRDQIRDKLPYRLEDRGEHQVKNIARPVRVFAINFELQEAAAPSGSRTVNEPLPLPEKPSIAVLPFTNIGGDPEQEYFADGIVEDLITGLSRIRWLFTIARNSSFTYKGRQDLSISAVGRELGVRYVLQGSIRRSGSRVRVTAQLADAMHGSNLWGDRYDRDLGDIFALQDDITRSVLSAIEPTMRLVEIERTRAKPTESLQAYDLYLRALPALAAYTRDGFRRAEELLTEAIARDATFAEALASLADSLFRQVVNGWHDLAKGKEARVLALRAAQLDPANGQALSIASFVLAGLEGRRTEGNELADRALDLHPNSAFVRTNCGWTYIYSCNPELALAQFHEARRMSPLDPRSSHTFNGIAVALFCLERYDEALLWVERARQQSPSQNVSRRWAAAILVQLGRLDEAREIVSEMCRLAPEYTITRLASHSIRCEPAMSRYLAALRAAGVPE